MSQAANGVHHVAWCVRPESIERVRALWSALGVTLDDLDLPDLGLHVMISWDAGVEIMSPIYDDGTLVASARRFLDERGEGVYSVVFNVASIDGAKAQVAAQGGKLVFEEHIPAEEVDERPLAGEGAPRFDIRQALYEDICGMRICLQEMTPLP